MAAIFGNKSTGSTTASRVPLLSILGTAPPVATVGGAGINPLLTALRASRQSGGDLTAQNRRAKNPRGLYRRSARANYAQEHGLANADWRTWDAANRTAAQELGILPGGEKHANQFRQEFGHDLDLSDPLDNVQSVGSKLANIRWHGNPDGPVDVNASLEQVNALRRAARRPQTYATRS